MQDKNGSQPIKKMFAGIFGIAGTSVLNKLVTFLTNWLIIRFVTKTEYGFFTSSYNTISIIILFTGLGTLSSVLQYGSEDRKQEEKNAYFKYAAGVGLSFDILLSIGLVIFALGRLLPMQGSTEYTLMLTPIIILHFLFEYGNAILRSEKRVKEYILCVNTNSFSNAILSCAGAFIWGVYGVIIGKCLAYLCAIILEGKYLKEDLKGIRRASDLPAEKKKELLKFSISCCVVSALNRALYLTDVEVISRVVMDADLIATYKVGTQIPEALEFIPQSILVVIVPYFAEHNRDIPWLREWTKKLYLFSGGLNILITAGLLVFSGFVISVYGGANYADSLPVYRVLVISYFFLATFRQTGTNIISTLRKVRYNVIISVITLVLNLIIDIIFVMNRGIMGAAYATLASVIISSLLSFPYVWYLIYTEKGNRQILNNPTGEKNE